MELEGVFAAAGCRGFVCAAPVVDGEDAGVELAADTLVTPASVMKIQVALTALSAFADGTLDPRSRILLAAAHRTPGPVGLSLLVDDVEMSLRDLVPLALALSDNVATDALISAVGLSRVNALTRGLGLTRTEVTSDLGTMLNRMAGEVGFADWRSLEDREPTAGGDSTPDRLRERLAAGTQLDPTRGTRTTARETVRLLRLVWTDRAGPPDACARVRELMGQQVTRTRIASGFGPSVRVAAKSGGLLGVVRNEAGVVIYPDGRAYAVAVFTRTRPGHSTDDRTVDTAIGRAAAIAVATIQGVLAR